MRLIFLIWCVFISGINSSLAGLEEDTVLVNGCTLISWGGMRFKNFPGSFCQFYDDGSFLSANPDTLKYIDKESAIKWTYSGHIHHQVNLTNDRQRILIMSSDYFDKPTKGYRIDKFLILSKDGKVLHRQNASELLKQVNREGYDALEMTHFNSFYQIPEITGPAPDYIKEGNFILNSNRVGIFIVSADLKKVLHFRRIKSSADHQVHDAQILPNGHLIYFNNTHVPDEEGKNNYSTIEELDLNSEKMVFEFKAEPKGSFYSRHCGGVQRIDEDRVLFSHMLTGTYLFSQKKKDFQSHMFQTHLGEGGRFFPSQQVKAMDLRSFLSHWKSN